MEGVCYLKNMNNLVGSVVNPVASGIQRFPLNTRVDERTRTYLKRASPDDTCSEHSSPRKLHLSTCLHGDRQSHDIKLVTHDKNSREYDINHLDASSTLDSRRTMVFQRLQEMSFEIANKQEPLEMPSHQMSNEHLDTSWRIGHEENIQSSNVSRFEKASLEIDEDHMVSKQYETCLDSEARVKRCRSLPCKSKHDIHQDESLLHFLKKRCQSQYFQREDVHLDEAPDGKQKERCKQLYSADIFQNGREFRSEQSSGDSGPATPSSCYIDVEAERSPCSPLNLTTNDSDIQLPNSNIPINADKLLTDISCLTEHEDSLTYQHHMKATKANGESVSNNKSQEKKTNFSIDAILKPDFGSARALSESSLKKCKTASMSPCLMGTIKSLHSAFTAVDLSIRSRSDSLSSPSCSSSSPSPTLSTCSTSPRLKRDFNSKDKHVVQDRFMFSSRPFPDQNTQFHHLFNSHIPFINPLHTNGFGNFPFPCTPQEGFQNKAVFEQESLRYQHSQQNPRTKSDYLKNDISKFLSRSLYPYISPTPNCRPDLLKHNTIQENGGKAESCATSHSSRQNKSTKNSIHTTASIKCEKSSTEKVTDSKRGSRSQVDSNQESDNSDNCKMDFKQEHHKKRSDKSDDSESKGEDGNQLWPAWVFCTRYSDRPSSGPRSRKPKRSKAQEEKRPRTAFTNDQLVRLKKEFEDCRYLTEARRKSLADELGLTESQIKIWFQNKRAKIKKSVGVRNPLALQLMEQGLYNHSTVRLSDDSN